ncbi:hypothetical protein ANAEL_00075 [Anaerolineales bacterium]|nr:hypothetical protein ANAEL_00075 [Anaerolineales bacterium]
MWKRVLQGIVLAAVVVLGIKTGIENFQSSLAERSNDAAVIGAWNERLSKLTAPIPFERGFVGYLSNADIPGANYSSDDAEGEFVLTQYAITPLILVRGTEQEWNILNLDRGTFEKWQQENAGKFEVVKSGGGMYLVHKVTQ